jgi:hypothetical protein
VRTLVAGAAGFIASNGPAVRGLDNFSTGRREFLGAALASGSFELGEADLLAQGKTGGDGMRRRMSALIIAASAFPFTEPA